MLAHSHDSIQNLISGARNGNVITMEKLYMVSELSVFVTLCAVTTFLVLNIVNLKKNISKKLSKYIEKVIETNQKYLLTVIETIFFTYRNIFQLSVIDIDYRPQLSISNRLSIFDLVIDIDYRKKYFKVIVIDIGIELQLSIIDLSISKVIAHL